MDKIVLHDGTTINIEESNSTYSFSRKYLTVEEYLVDWKKLNKSNLSKYQIQNESGIVCANPENKECISHTVETVWGSEGTIAGVHVTYHITDVDMVNERLTAIEEGQGVQDGAIGDLGEAVGTLAEGGTA